MKYHKLCIAVAMFATMVAVGSASAVCTNASLIGVVGYITIATSPIGPVGGSVGQITYDGNGNFTATAINNGYGTIVPVSYSGVYSVAKNCTGTMTITSPTHNTFDIVLDDAKKGAVSIETDGVYMASGFSLPQGVVTCGLTGKKQTFAVNLAGNTINTSGTSPVIDVGQVTLNGAGGLSGSATFNLDGTISSASLTGTYTENSNCTGTAQMTLSGFPTSNYYFVVVNSGKEMLAIETDTNTVVTGTMQQ